MKIGFFELEGWEEPMLRSRFPGHELRFFAAKLTEAELPAERDFDALAVFVDSRVTDKVLSSFPKLKLVTTRSTGFDHIDVAACKKRKIAAVYVPGYGDNTVAELAFGLILSLTRKLYLAIDQVKEIESFSQRGLRGIDLKGRTLGVIGTGRIGKEAIRIGNGFGMHIIAFDPFPDAAAAKALGFSYTTLEGVLAASDVITIHCPLSDMTRHLINRENVGYIKRGAYLVNTARGGIVETAALVHALEEGILAGAGLDVLEEEGDTKDEMKFLSQTNPREATMRVLLENHALMRMPNVLITPHNAFNSEEAFQRILETTMKNIETFIAGKPVNLIP